MPKQPKEKNIIESIREVIKDELQPIKEEFTDKLDEVLISNDKIVKRLDTIETELVSIGNGLSRHDKDIENLKGRTGVIEKKIGLKLKPAHLT